MIITRLLFAMCWLWQTFKLQQLLSDCSFNDEPSSSVSLFCKFVHVSGKLFNFHYHLCVASQHISNLQVY